MSSERKLLLACARSRLTPEDRRRIIELAGGDLDWDQLAIVSYAHGIAPLVYHSLVESDAIGLVTVAVAQKLRSSYYANAARNSLLYDELKTLQLALGQEKLDVIILKGAALAETVYPHRALRPMSDIDLLVRRERLANVESKLLSMDYAVDASTHEHHREHHYHLVFTKSAAPSIEVHWHLQRPTGPFRIDIQNLWERSQKTQIAGVEALVLSTEDLVLHLCQHFWKHNLAGGIRPICDIAETTRYYGDAVDWTKVANTSSKWEMNAASYLVLSLARELLDAPIPKDFLNEVRPVNFNMGVIHWAREAVLGYGECPLVFPDLVKLFWKGFSSKERWAILQKTLSRDTVARYANDTMAAKRGYLYYPLRMKHLLTQYGPTVGRLWAGDRRIRAAVATEEKQQRLTKWLSNSY